MRSSSPTLSLEDERDVHTIIDSQSSINKESSISPFLFRSSGDDDDDASTLYSMEDDVFLETRKMTAAMAMTTNLAQNESHISYNNDIVTDDKFPKGLVVIQGDYSTDILETTTDIINSSVILSDIPEADSHDKTNSPTSTRQTHEHNNNNNNNDSSLQKQLDNLAQLGQRHHRQIKLLTILVLIALLITATCIGLVIFYSQRSSSSSLRDDSKNAVGYSGWEKGEGDNDEGVEDAPTPANRDDDNDRLSSLSPTYYTDAASSSPSLLTSSESIIPTTTSTMRPTMSHSSLPSTFVAPSYSPTFPSSSNDNNQSTDLSVNPTLPSLYPSSLPTVSKITRYSYLRRLIEPLSSSSSNQQSPLDDATTPQYRALHWMTYVDSQPITTPNNDPIENDDDIIISMIRRRYTLVVFYYATNGDTAWRVTDDWLTSSSECNWYGVICETQQESETITTLQELNLEDNNLSGSLPPEINFLFDKLKTLNLRHNELTGSLLPPFHHPSDDDSSSLFLLSSLHLNDNLFSGTIPSTLFFISSLRDLSLGDNHLRGPLPNLTSSSLLARLDLSGNRLTGTIPPFLISSLSRVVILNMADNKLSGTIPSNDWDQWKELIDLRLDHNELTGSIPSGLGQLNELQVLRLHRNNLSGTIPLELFFSGSSLLSLSQNNPSSKTTCSLVDLRLQRNNLTGSIPPSIPTSCPNLVMLNLGQNSLTGTIPTEGWTNLHRLSYLHLRRNRLRGDIPPGWVNLKDLKNVTVEYNKLREGAVVPRDMCDLENLVRFSVDCVVECQCCTRCY